MVGWLKEATTQMFVMNEDGLPHRRDRSSFGGEKKFMPYSELLIKPMREDLTRLGIKETRTPEAVDETIKNTAGTVMVIVNSVCGCAAAKRTIRVAFALGHPRLPRESITVFASG